MSTTDAQKPRTIIGPLTTTFTPPSSCTNVVAECPYSCSVGRLAQTCATVSESGQTPASSAADATNCWPPASSNAPTPTAPFNGWGFYSPGLICPAGYTSACSATQGGTTVGGHGVEYSMLPSETAVGCCPMGYTCSVNDHYQTCQSGAGTYASFPVVTCEAGSSNGLTNMVIPTTVTVSESTYAITTYQNYAPMIEIRWQSSDLPPNSTSSNSGSTDSSSIRNNSTAASTELPTGVKIALAVVIPIVLLAAAAFGIFFYLGRRRRRRLRDTRNADNSFSSPASNVIDTGGFSPIHSPLYFGSATNNERPPELPGHQLHEMEEQRRAQEMDSKTVVQQHVRYELQGHHQFESMVKGRFGIP